MISIFVWVILIAMLALMAVAYVNNRQQARRQSRKNHLEERRERFFKELTRNDVSDNKDSEKE